MTQKDFFDAAGPGHRRNGRLPALFVTALLFCASSASAHTSGNGPYRGMSATDAGHVSAGERRDAGLRTVIRSDDGLHVDVVLTNDGPDTITVLTRDTPLDAHRLAPPLAIERLQASAGTDEWQRQPVAWQGRVAKRMPPGPDELLALAPGQSVSARIALDKGWHIERVGEYRVGLAMPWRTAAASPATLVSRSVSRRQRLDHDLVDQPMPAAVDITLLDNASPLEAVLRLRTPQYAQCSAQQQQGILEAASAAERLVSGSVAGLSELSADELADSPRYRAWFGEYDRRRAANVIGDLTAIRDTIAGDTLRFNCDCSEAGVFAYVYPVRPYDVWLCPSFWSASVEGTDSRAGTVIHELSHFMAVAGTSDHAYSQANAGGLADTDPELAIDNADSFEYFVENTPAIALRGAGASSARPGTAADEGQGAVLSGRLSQGQQQSYTIESGRSVAVESLDGDADLFVYSGRSSETGDLACASREPPGVSSIDRCELDGPGPWTAVVVAYTDVRYSLTVQGAGTSGSERPSDDDPLAGSSGGPGGGSGGELGGGSGGGAAGGGAGAAGPLGALVITLLAALRGRRSRHVVPALLLAAAAGSGCASQAAAGSAAGQAPDSTPVPTSGSAVSMALSSGPGAGTTVRVTLHNPGTMPARVLVWGTPFEPTLSADAFVVRARGERVPYTGRVVKRALPPPADAWLVLQPDERLQVDVDLAEAYAMDGEGPWRVTLDASRLEAPAMRSGSALGIDPDRAPVVLR